MNEQGAMYPPQPMVSIDGRCRIVDVAIEHTKAIFISRGFRVENLQLYPASTDWRLQWRRSVREVLSSKEPQYVIVREHPRLVCALLLNNPVNNTVKVSLSMSGICNSESTEKIGQLMGFTKREKEVVLLLAQGYDTGEVAKLLGTQISTVRSQIKSVMMKSGISGLRNFLVFLSCIPEIPHDSQSDWVSANVVGGQ